MKMTLVKKSGGLGRLSARDVPEDKALRFCRAALNKSLGITCWTNDKSVRLVTVSGKKTRTTEQASWRKPPPYAP
jgi:hypothetical protein